MDVSSGCNVWSVDVVSHGLSKKKKASQSVDCEALHLMVPRDRIELPTRGFSLGVYHMSADVVITIYSLLLLAHIQEEAFQQKFMVYTQTSTRIPKNLGQ